MNTGPSTGALLRSLCLTTMVKQYEQLGRRAEKDSWGYTQYLQNLCEVELSERAARRVKRRLKQSGLPEGKTLESLEQDQLPAKVRRQIPRLLEGTFVERADNILAFGLPGRGKSGLLSAIARELIINKGYRHPMLQVSTSL